MTDPAGGEAVSSGARGDDMARLASGRSHCYGLFALVLRDSPTSDAIAQLRAPPLSEALSDLGYDPASDLAGDLEQVTQQLSEEYTRVFIGPGPHAAPFGSVYHEREGGLWGDSTVRLKRLIEWLGLSFQGNWDSIPDHVSTELELMQRLAAHEAGLWEAAGGHAEPAPADHEDELRRCLETEQEFLRDYLCTWLPKFCHRASSLASMPFYREIVGLAEQFVAQDLEQVDSVLADLASP